MTRKLLSGMLACFMLLSLTNSKMVVNAETMNSDNAGSIKFIEIADEEKETEVIEGKSANIIERTYSGKTYTRKTYSGSTSMFLRGVSPSNESEDEVTNTDPNHAYWVSNDIIEQSGIETANEMRWYNLVLDEKSKVTILLQMVEALDADIYMFSLNEETNQLELYGGSANEGLGITEYYNSVMSAGTYYFAISGYESTGAFAFAYYQSSADVTNEVNDSAETATKVVLDNPISGVIDNPNDIDYYTFTVSKPTIFRYSISSVDGYSLLYAGKSGSSSAIYALKSDNPSYKLMPGTYYFAVVSENGSYSTSSTYTAKFEQVGAMSGDSSITLIGISEEADIVYETNNSGSINYVNGHPVDISYSYVQNLSNSAGSQSYNISIDADAGACAILTDVYEPAAVHYHKSTKPAMQVSSRPALMLTFYDDSDFYHIYCTGSGAYSMNTLWKNFDYVTVLIDPDTGKLIDIVEFNYYYDFAPVGTNSITYTRPYSMKFYDN